MIKTWIIGLIFLGVFPFNNANASLKSDYDAAKKQLYRGHIQAFRQAIEQDSLSNLKPELEYRYLLKYMRTRPADAVEAAIDSHQNEWFYAHLIETWLDILMRKNDRERFMSFFEKHGSKSASKNCYYLHHKYRESGDLSSITAQIESRWLHGKSQPKYCDPVFNAAIKNQIIDDALFEERIVLAVQAREYSLASYLNKKRPSSDQRVTRLLQALKAPHRFGSLKLKDIQLKNEDLKHAFLFAWLGKSWVTFKDMFKKHQTDLPATPQFLEKICHKAVRKDNLLDIQFFCSNLKSPSNATAQKLITYYLRRGKLAQLNQWLAKAYPKLLSGQIDNATPYKAAYWFAKTHDNPSDSQTIYKLLAEKRHYYGFLSSQKLSKAITLNHQEIMLSDSELSDLNQSAIMKKIEDLYAVGERYYARRAYHHMIKTISSQNVPQFIKAAQFNGWYDRAIVTSPLLPHNNDLSLRFPLAYSDHFAKAASNTKLPQAFLMAISRQESLFQTDAVSSANAHGIMQLLPATARDVAKRHQLKRPTTQSLKNKEINIKLGSLYLKRLSKQFNQAFHVMAAGYNAGPHRAKKWLQQGPKDTEMWIETIPFSETRSYVKQVLTGMQIYEAHLASLQ